MSTLSLVTLPVEHLRILAANRAGSTGGGNASERGIASIVAVAAIVAAAVLSLIA